MAEHAQGPWSVCLHLHPATAGDCKCGYRGCIWAADGKTMVCELGEPPINPELAVGRPMPMDERIATAALIAAAPELLEACESALATMPPDEEQSERELRATRLLRAAIKKARGGA